jgi:hypothetical protein
MQSPNNITNSNFYAEGSGNVVVNNTNLSVGGNWLQNAYGGAWGTAVGIYALADLDTSSVTTGGYNNTACGFASLRTLVDGEKNTAVGARTLYYCTASNNTGVGNQAGDNVSSGEDNVLIGPEAGGSLTVGNCNVCIGSHCGVYSDDCSNAIVLGSRDTPSSAAFTNTASNQLYIAPAVTSFNFPSLAASTGSGEGTIIEYDSSGNIIPSAGTYNSVSKIDTEISTLQSSITSNGTDISTLQACFTRGSLSLTISIINNPGGLSSVILEPNQSFYLYNSIATLYTSFLPVILEFETSGPELNSNYTFSMVGLPGYNSGVVYITCTPTSTYTITQQSAPGDGTIEINVLFSAAPDLSYPMNIYVPLMITYV